MVPCKIDDMTEKAAKELLKKIVDKLDESSGNAFHKERFSIKEKLRDFGKITDDELETFRNTFFAAQDSLFDQQEKLIEHQEDLRLAIRFFK